MYFSQLADRARYFKKTEEGEQAMCKMMEDMRRETEEKTLINVIKNIMDTTSQTAEEVMSSMKIPVSEFPKYIAML